uniref:Fatty acid synthase n=1 Tax=Cacopsylla melanoneura TaxID=428564 RepID=A0A8D8UL46_9HEMI
MAPEATTTVKLSSKELALKAGRRLAMADPGDEICITGIAGVFPDSHDVRDFGEKLNNKVDLISDDDRRWKLEHPEIPQRTGKLYEVNRFDAAFFGVHFKQAHTMDPMCRIILEKTYEAVIDAGINPKSLRGSKTGVFIGACFSESEKTWFYEKLQINGFGITGCSRAMLANRVSYWLGVNGPSYTVDSACSSSLYALEHAYKSIRDGHCDAAFVGGCNLCLHPYVSLQFARLGVLSPDGRCKSFDEAANGYCRSEAVCIMLLQKQKDSKRIYARVVHAKTNCDGYKEQGITYPSGQLQQRLLEDFYEECEVDPKKLAWVEAHGTGTKVGDPEEVQALENVFCPGRDSPLLIGSVKSNIGHSEPASGVCSVTKVILSMENGFIPPNINFKSPRKDIPSFHNGKIRVVTEKQPWDGGLVGINSFGFGGANCHVLLESNPKLKSNNGLPSDDLPRLVCASGRTEEAVEVMLNDLESRPLDVEFVRLFHDIHNEDIAGHVYRGYTILSKKPNNLVRSITHFSGETRPIWFVFSGMGSQWTGMGADLMRIPAFAAAIEKCHNVLKPKGVDVKRIITENNPKIFDNIFNSFVGIAAIQIGLVDVLQTLNIVPDHIIGHSVGELGCAYADGCFTIEQTILAAYYRGLASIETEFIRGSMAAIGLGYKDIRSRCPPEIEIACHNGPDSSTISGPEEAVKRFVGELQADNIFAKTVNVSNIAYHSRYIANAGPKLLKYLKQVIPNPKPRSPKWLSTSNPESSWNTNIAKYSSPEYHTNNLLSPVLFEETSKHIQRNAITVEIAPHGLLQAILKRSLPKGVTNVPLTQKDNVKGELFLLQALGRLFEAGVQPHLANIYPKVEFPVSRGTPMIAPLVRWEHSEDWYVTTYRMQEKLKSGERAVTVSLKDDDMEFVSGHVIDGRNLFPATGYLQMAWETVSLMRGELYTEVPVVFENVKFMRATNVPKDGTIEFVVMVQKGTGNFEIVEGGAAIVTGTVRIPNDVKEELVTIPEQYRIPKTENIELQSRDIYKELRLRGYHYKGLFRSLNVADASGTQGRIRWHNNWVAFMDNMLQLQILQYDTRGLFVPTSLQRLVIDVSEHINLLSTLDEENPEYPVFMYKEVEMIKSGGVEIRGLKASAIPRKKLLGEPVLEKYQFIANEGLKNIDLAETVRICAHIAFENIPNIKVKTLELLDTATPQDTTLLSPIFSTLLGDLPLIQAEVNLSSPSDNPLLEDIPSTVTVEDKKLPSDQSCLLAAAHELLSRSEILVNLLNAVKEGGFIISREKVDTEVIVPEDTVVAYIGVLENEKIVLLKKTVKAVVDLSPIIIKISSAEFDWMPILQKALTAEETSAKQKIILLAQDEPLSGIVGFFNCIRKENGGERTRCFEILDKAAPPFDLENPFYKNQIEKDLAVNIYKNGQWGSYRHSILKSTKYVEANHAFINSLVRGDMSSLTWEQGPIDVKSWKPHERDTAQLGLAQIYCASINFRDIMLTTAKLAPEVIEQRRLYQHCVIGFEFSGRLRDTGKRIMGMTSGRSLSNCCEIDLQLCWEIPDEWSLEEAATVPVVYATAVYAMFVCGQMKRGESILIHAGSGGVGQAAIYLAKFMNAEIFTTVGTPEKREFIKKTFPFIKEENIGNSRDTSFEQLVMKRTKGKGVDLVLNSLAEEKLLASTRCLAHGGRFLEIGKFDLAQNNPLGMEMFLKETSFHGVMLDNFFFAEREWKLSLVKSLQKAIDAGAVFPLNRTVFPEDKVEDAFRYMAAGKHVGKVIIKIRDEEKEKEAYPTSRPLLAVPRHYCNENKTYIICGGLGGFGLELADWLVLRGARKLVLTSRTGLKNGYQALRIKIWKTYNCQVLISTDDITTEEGVRNLLITANNLGPVDGIFNLAVVLKDALFENQTPEDFVASLGPKAHATQYFDKLSRTLCPSLSQFVVFSSVSCGRGNAGQTNYGMSNSIMERICEARRAEGLPGLAVEWGAIGEVGLVADMAEDNLEVVIGGTLQQRISNCLECMNEFLIQSEPIVASMVVAEKKSGSGGATNIVDAVINILGLRDLKTVSLHSTLAELGMDSMMAVEIKQTLEREFEVFLTPQDIRSLTFAKLQEISESFDSNDKSGPTKTDGSGAPTQIGVEDIPNFGIQYLMRTVGDERLAGKPVLRLPSLKGNGSTDEDAVGNNNTVFMIPGIEGVASVLEPLARNINAQVLAFQFDYANPPDTIPGLADSILPHFQKRLVHGTEEIKLVGFSFGGLVALEIALKLQALGRRCHLYLIDSAPEFIRLLAQISLKRDEKTEEDEVQNVTILRLIELIAPQDTQEVLNTLRKQPNWDAKLDYFLSIMPEKEDTHSKSYQRNLANSGYIRVLSILKYKDPKFKSFDGAITLIRPSEQALTTGEDYGLGQLTKKTVKVHFVDGNHFTVLENLKTAQLIMEEDSTDFKDSLFTQDNSEDKLLGGVK